MVFHREKKEIETTRFNSDFERVKDDIEALIRDGSLNNISVLPSDKQDLSPQMGIGRSLHLAHSDLPGWRLVVGGIGQVSRDNDDVLHVHDIQTDKTVHALPGVTGYAQQTFLVNKDGSYGYEEPNDPLGGYWQQSAEKKYDNTVKAQDLLQGTTLKSVVPVLAGGYKEDGQPTGFFVYAVPKQAVSLSHLFQTDYDSLIQIDHQIQEEGRKAHNGRRVYIISHPPELTATLENGSYLQALRIAVSGVRHVSNKDYLHRQIHMGQLHAVLTDAGDVQDVYLGDWHTLQSIADYPREVVDSLGRSPHAEAQWQEIRHFVVNALNFSLPADLGSRSILTRLKPNILIQMMANYAYTDPSHISTKIKEWREEYGTHLLELYTRIKKSDPTNTAKVNLAQIQEEYLENLLEIPGLFS